MAKFVKLESGSIINVDMIVEIGRCKDLRMCGRCSELVTQKDIDNIMKASEE